MAEFISIASFLSRYSKTSLNTFLNRLRSSHKIGQSQESILNLAFVCYSVSIRILRFLRGISLRMSSGRSS